MEPGCEVVAEPVRPGWRQPQAPAGGSERPLYVSVAHVEQRHAITSPRGPLRQCGIHDRGEQLDSFEPAFTNQQELVIAEQTFGSQVVVAPSVGRYYFAETGAGFQDQSQHQGSFRGLVRDCRDQWLGVAAETTRWGRRPPSNSGDDTRPGFSQLWGHYRAGFRYAAHVGLDRAGCLALSTEHGNPLVAPVRAAHRFGNVMAALGIARPPGEQQTAVAVVPVGTQGEDAPHGRAVAFGGCLLVPTACAAAKSWFVW